ncbi:hypothetical protein A2U01_0074525, partial [Trifolium medium]|nr:hypothetical protein [Trifolium medium]
SVEICRSKLSVLHPWRKARNGLVLITAVASCRLVSLFPC